jgi:hypothetical protein
VGKRGDHSVARRLATRTGKIERDEQMDMRLALREEGPFWNAYLALPNTMHGARLIGSIAIGPMKRNEKLREHFKALMKECLAEAIKELTGKTPGSFREGPAPEAERAGHG